MTTSTANNTLWIISRGAHTGRQPTPADGSPSDRRTVEYRISDLARYLLNPKPIEIQKKLIGCEVHYVKRKGGKRREKIWQILPNAFNSRNKLRSTSSEVFIPQISMQRPKLQDRGLESHLEVIYGHLKAYDPVYQGLTSLDHSQVADIVGICEDVDGNRSRLNLIGTVPEKADYIGTHMFLPVGVVLDNAQLSEGLFEMRGYDFQSFDPARAHRLIKTTQDGETKACVLDADMSVAYWLADIRLIRYMVLLEQSIHISPDLKNGLLKCTQGQAQPYKLFFKNDSAVTYADGHLPQLYREAIESVPNPTGPQEQALIQNALNGMQIGVVFNFVSGGASHDRRLVTTLSVLHDVRALESLKDELPLVYSAVREKASIARAGRFYLLDAIKGYQDV